MKPLHSIEELYLIIKFEVAGANFLCSGPLDSRAIPREKAALAIQTHCRLMAQVLWVQFAGLSSLVARQAWVAAAAHI